MPSSQAKATAMCWRACAYALTGRGSQPRSDQDVLRLVGEQPKLAPSAPPPREGCCKWVLSHKEQRSGRCSRHKICRCPSPPSPAACPIAPHRAPSPHEAVQVGNHRCNVVGVAMVRMAWMRINDAAQCLQAGGGEGGDSQEGGGHHEEDADTCHGSRRDQWNGWTAIDLML